MIDTTFPNADKDEGADIVLTKASHADDDSVLIEDSQSVYLDSYSFEGEIVTTSKARALYVGEEGESQKADQYVNGFDGF